MKNIYYSVGQGKISTTVLVREKYLLQCWSGKNNYYSVGQGKISTTVLVREKYPRVMSKTYNTKFCWVA
jgi:hypothetical protein